VTHEDSSLTANQDNSKTQSETPKKEWQPMRLKYAGEAKDVVRTGGGKTSPSPADPGDTRKPPGQS
jgi:hypothetical protein